MKLDRSVPPTVMVSHRVPAWRYEAITKWCYNTKKSQTEFWNEGHVTNPEYQTLEQEYKEAYAKTINQHKQKVDIFVQKFRKDIGGI